MPARETAESKGGMGRLLQGASAGAALVSGVADVLDIPKRLDQLPALAPLADSFASSLVWGPAAAVLVVVSLALRRGTPSQAAGTEMWQAPDQEQARAANPGYTAMIKSQPRVMGLSAADLAAEARLQRAEIDAILQEPTRLPTQPIIGRLEAAFRLPKGACGPRGVVVTGRFPHDRYMIWRLTWLGDRRLVEMLASDGSDLSHDVAAFRVQRARLLEVYRIAMTARYHDVRIEAKEAII